MSDVKTRSIDYRESHTHDTYVHSIRYFIAKTEAKHENEYL